MFGVLVATLGLAACAFVTGLRPNLVADRRRRVRPDALALTLLNGVYTTIIQVKVPQRFHGRVFALNTLIAWSTMPIGFGIVAPSAPNCSGRCCATAARSPAPPARSSAPGPGAGIGLMFAVLAISIAADRRGRAAPDAAPLRRRGARRPADDLVGLAVLDTPATDIQHALDAAARAAERRPS